MSFLVIGFSALVVSALTLFSGFGLGTLLMPAFALFFPLEMAVAATAVVHGANNVFKIIAVGRDADRQLVLKFGIPAILAAFLGAAVLGAVSEFGEVAVYTLGSRTCTITPIKLTMAVLMLFFALAELVPKLKNLRFSENYLVLGGLLSGFFGGLSGHQGALRAAFLVKTGISARAFIGTSAFIGFLVDLARTLTYAAIFMTQTSAHPLQASQWPLIATGIAAAFLGVMIGKRHIRKVKIELIQTLTGLLLFGIALGLGSGLI